MVEVVVDHHLDRAEDIHVHVGDDQGHALDAVPDQGKDTVVEIGVLEKGKGHDLEKSHGLEIENVNHLEKDEEQGPNLGVVQDLEAIKRIKNILQKEKTKNQKNGKKKIRKKIIRHLLYLKLRKKISQILLKKKNPDQLHHQEVILGVPDHLVNHLEEVVRLVEERLLNQLRAVRLVTLDAHCLRKDLEQELRLENVLVGLLEGVEHLRNAVENQILLKGVLENEVLVVNHEHLLKKDIDEHAHLYVDLHLPDHLLLEELLEHHL